MTQKAETIEHPAVITKVSDNIIEVMILSKSACSSCNAKGSCNMSEMEEKIVSVARIPNLEYAVGQQVVLYMQQQLGTIAVFLGYILPFLLVLLTLIVMIASGFSEGLAGLSALLVLIPYYIVIYLLRSKLGRKFQFYIKAPGNIDVQDFSVYS
ncbi:MAG: SoxR reducing system RseC family protein [Bacteroidales bacterium]|nr:SoxR reducing system RseC family protein [Bacteroidales bacterium]MDP2236340.1 SoxR reducing system RseC family protein [Bacteroidales bacterium]